MAHAPSPLDGTVSVLIVRALTVAAKTLGIDDLATRADVPAALFAELADPDARVSARLVVRLWSVLPRLSGREDFGLWLAAQNAGAPLGPAWYVVHASETLGAGLRRAVRYQRLLHDHARSTLTETATELVYRHSIGDGAFRAPSAAIEFGLASLVLLARRVTGLPVVPARVRLVHGRPRDLEAHHAIFGEQIEFDAASDELAFDHGTAHARSVFADRHLREILDAHATALLARLGDPCATTATRVRREIAERLGDGVPDLHEIATAIGLSTRSMQRRLHDEGTRFDLLVDDVRRALAERYLARWSIQETAFLLGYADARAFHRAFVRWTGSTPAQYRKDLR
jgi:AraC-like DNA-binding protein